MLRSSSLMRIIAKDLFPAVHDVSAIILVSIMLSLSFPWQFLCSLSAQDDEEEEDVETAGANDRDDNNDNGFTVIIPENAAWSQSIDQRFNPSNITIPAGTEVTWINFGNAVHTVTADDGSFNSGNLNKDQSFSRTFNVTGVYKYHCSIHPSMTGTVIVISESKGDLNNNGISADAGDLVLMKRASLREIAADSRYDLNNNGEPADAGDLVLMKRASIGEVIL